jgi:hypothetical protein
MQCWWQMAFLFPPLEATEVEGRRCSAVAYYGLDYVTV